MSNKNPREILQEYKSGFKDFMKDSRDTARAIINQSQALNCEGALSYKQKELIMHCYRRKINYLRIEPEMGYILMEI